MKYILHDAIINNIVCTEDGIELYFDKGVYVINEKGQEAEISGPCRISINIQQFDSCKMFEHITITKSRKSKITDIEYEDFLKSVRKYSFKLYVDYYSFFAESILLIGSCGENMFYFTITEVEKVDYIFEKY